MVFRFVIFPMQSNSVYTENFFFEFGLFLTAVTGLVIFASFVVARLCISYLYSFSAREKRRIWHSSQKVFRVVLVFVFLFLRSLFRVPFPIVPDCSGLLWTTLTLHERHTSQR